VLADELAREAKAHAAAERKRRILTAALAATVLATALVVGGGWALGARDRAARDLRTAVEVDAALATAAELRERARSAPAYDPARWVEATEAARRADLLLGRGGGSPDLQRRVGELLAAIADEHRRADTAAEDRNMVRRLADIHADVTFHLDRAREDAQYAAAFRRYGIPVDDLGPAEAGARIAARPIAVELAGALDHWAFSRRRARPPRIAEAQHLVRVARLADPDPWRNQLRDALDLMTSDRGRARAELERLAASADADGLIAASAERLASALADLGNGEAAVALYRAAQRAHPDHFWINSNLASALVRQGRYDEAVRFASVAVALRPRSVQPLITLGWALHHTGRPDDAAATLREALRLRPEDPIALATLDAILKDRGGPAERAAGPGEKIPAAR
jgi:serine/threonine-protein kinase